MTKQIHTKHFVRYTMKISSLFAQSAGQKHRYIIHVQSPISTNKYLATLVPGGAATLVPGGG